MSKELINLWRQYIATERYEQIRVAAKATSMGMGFLGGDSDVFTDFMNWLMDKQGTSA